MDYEPIITGGGGGLIGGIFTAVLGLLGIRERLQKVEDHKQDKDVCDAKHQLVAEIKEDLCQIRADIQYIRARMDKLSNGF